MKVDRVGTPRAGMIVAAVVVLLAGIVAAATKTEPGPGPGEATIQVDGKAKVTRADGREVVITDRTRLGRGDEVELLEGTALLTLPRGTTLEGRVPREGHNTPPTRLRVGLTPELIAGDLLVVAKRPQAIDAGGNRVELSPGDSGTGATRVTRSLSVLSGVYAGAVSFDSAGQERQVPALRELAVAVLGSPPAAAEPLQYDETDPWDLRFLGGAIDLGRRLDSLGRAYTESLRPGEGHTVGFFRLVLPALETEPAFSDDLLPPTRPPGETLVGAAISLVGQRGSFAQRWQSVFSFRSEGATWGLVALDQGVTEAPVLRQVESALNATELDFAGPSVSRPSTTRPPTTTNPTNPSPSPSPTSPSPSPASPPPPPPPPSPPTSLLPDLGIPLLDALIEPIEQLLLSLLNPQGASHRGGGLLGG